MKQLFIRQNYDRKNDHNETEPLPLNEHNIFLRQNNRIICKKRFLLSIIIVTIYILNKYFLWQGLWSLQKPDKLKL